MDPSEAVYRALTGRSPRTEGRGLPMTIGELERAYGGPKGAAAAAGVSRETWRRWKLPAGQHLAQRPNARSLDRLSQAVHRARLAAGRRKRLLQGRPLIQFNGKTQVSSDNRDRSLGTESLRPSTTQIADLIDAYERNDHAGMETGLNMILDNYVPGMVATDVDSLWIGAGPTPEDIEDYDGEVHGLR